MNASSTRPAGIPTRSSAALFAFANDFENIGGGYVIIGQDCDENGQPIFPPAGLPSDQLDKIQRELLAACNLIQPAYFPILSIEEVEGRKLIVLWAPGGQNRPYEAPRRSPPSTARSITTFAAIPARSKLAARTNVSY